MFLLILTNFCVIIQVPLCGYLQHYAQFSICASLSAYLFFFEYAILYNIIASCLHLVHKVLHIFLLYRERLRRHPLCLDLHGPCGRFDCINAMESSLV